MAYIKETTEPACTSPSHSYRVTAREKHSWGTIIRKTCTTCGIIKIHETAPTKNASRLLGKQPHYRRTIQ